MSTTRSTVKLNLEATFKQAKKMILRTQIELALSMEFISVLQTIFKVDTRLWICRLDVLLSDRRLSRFLLPRR
eukprot:scaffold4962_cov112-Cylindrotheca_fusiformis.AAC.1